MSSTSESSNIRLPNADLSAESSHLSADEVRMVEFKKTHPLRKTNTKASKDMSLQLGGLSPEQTLSEPFAQTQSLGTSSPGLPSRRAWKKDKKVKKPEELFTDRVIEPKKRNNEKRDLKLKESADLESPKRIHDTLKSSEPKIPKSSSRPKLGIHLFTSEKFIQPAENQAFQERQWLIEKLAKGHYNDDEITIKIVKFTSLWIEKKKAEIAYNEKKGISTFAMELQLFEDIYLNRDKIQEAVKQLKLGAVLQSHKDFLKAIDPTSPIIQGSRDQLTHIALSIQKANLSEKIDLDHLRTLEGQLKTALDTIEYAQLKTQYLKGLKGDILEL